jgi:hypothetical protein
MPNLPRIAFVSLFDRFGVSFAEDGALPLSSYTEAEHADR